jgi:hypothetical protein
MSDPIATIEDNRTLILLAEVGALLHDLGKLSEEFIDQMSVKPTAISAGFGHGNILTDKWLAAHPHFVPSDLVTALKDTWWESKLQLPIAGAAQAERLERLITEHHKSGDAALVKTVIDCDRADSGVDKAIPQAKQVRDQTYIATVFGHEEPRKPIDLGTLTGIRGAVCQQLAELFDKYRNAKIDVAELREGVLRALLPFDEKGGFYAALGDTRRAANDVTLADHAYSVASIFKAALAESLIKDQLPEDQIRWKLLGVKWDGLEIISKAFRVNDVLGRWEMIRQVKKALRQFVELEFPIGNKIYDDESGIYFTVPNLDYGDTHAVVANDLRDRIVEIVNRESNGEIIPSLLLLERETRSLVHLTWLIKGEDRARGDEEDRQQVINLLEDRSFEPGWVARWDPVNRAQLDNCPLCGNRHYDVPRMEHRPLDVCPVCQVRPKREGIETCPFCRHWRGEGSRAREREGTRWLGLIADDNNQVALITGRFWLESWLHGEQTDTLFSQSLADWKQGGYADLASGLEHALDGSNLKILGEVGREAWRGFLAGKGLLSNWQGYVKDMRENVKERNAEDAELVGEFYDSVVMERDVHGAAPEAQSSQAPLWLAHFLFRKHPSPARLRRVWRTTQGFSRQMPRYLADALDSRTTWRFQLEGEFERGKIYEDATVDKTPAELYFDGRYFHVIERLKEAPRPGAEVRIEDSTYTLSEQAEDMPYDPYVSILISPVTFELLVPADKAPDIVKGIRARYQEEMGKVRNRLPLDIGIIYFKGKTPLYVAVDAARRMLGMRRESLSPELWTVLEQPQLDDINHKVHLVLQTAQGQRIEWDIGYELGDTTEEEDDTKKEDVYHPYFVVDHSDSTRSANQRPTHFHVPGLGDLVHVKELQGHDRIQIVPSYFDFEFLDSSTRRYDVRYAAPAGKRSHPVAGEAGPRPYYADELDTFARLWWMLSGRGDFELSDGSPWQGLTITQIKGLEAVLAERFVRWKPVSVTPEFAAAALANTFGSAWDGFSESDREAIHHACLSGQLFDVTELYIRLSGQKPMREEGIE